MASIELRLVNQPSRLRPPLVQTALDLPLDQPPSFVLVGCLRLPPHILHFEQFWYFGEVDFLVTERGRLGGESVRLREEV